MCTWWFKSIIKLSSQDQKGHKHLVPLLVRVQLPAFEERLSHIRSGKFVSKKIFKVNSK